MENRILDPGIFPAHEGHYSPTAMKESQRQFEDVHLKISKWRAAERNPHLISIIHASINHVTFTCTPVYNARVESEEATEGVRLS
jgi:hypothetical protein